MSTKLSDREPNRSRTESVLTRDKPWYAPLLALPLTFILLIPGDYANAGENFSIEVSNEDIAVEASNASLKELLLELEQLTGIPVKFVADTTERVTLTVGMTTVENAIAKITPNHMIVHENQSGKKVIKELIIIPGDTAPAGNTAGSSFLPNGQPAPVIEQPVQPAQQIAVDPVSNQPVPVNQTQPLQVDQTMNPNTQEAMPSANDQQVN